MVLAGLALNPAAPLDVLLRLLESGDGAVVSALCRRRRTFPEELVEAIVHHDAPRVRGAFARNPHVSGELRGRLVEDEHWLVRLRLASGPGWDAWPRHLPDWVLDRMYTTYDGDGLQELIASRQAPLRVLLANSAHPMASVRRYGTGMWSLLPEERRAALLSDPHPDVRATAAGIQAQDDAEEMERQWRAIPPSHARTHIEVNCRLSPAMVEELLRTRDPDDVWCLAHNYSTPPEVVASLAEHPAARIRLKVAARDGLPRELIDLLARDPDPEVRTVVSVRPELTEEERAAVDYVVDLDEDFTPDEDPYRAPLAHARSAHPLLRRRVAYNPALPAELVALLAADEDLGVRVLLAQHHPDAPPELLLRCYLEYTGPHRDRLLALPRFPVAGLAARFGAAEDRAVRLLATLDPEADPGLVDALTRDPEPKVRAGAARNPALPQARLHQLLDDQESGADAAANPALPVATMRRLLDA